MWGASIGPYAFRVEPMSVNWGYTVRYAVTPTIGGKVVQVLGANLEDLVLTGSFGTGGWREEREYLAQLTTIADGQTDPAGGKPVRFRFPAMGYDFQVFIKAIRPIAHTVGDFSPTWQLTLFIEEDPLGLTKTVKGDAMDAFIARLAEGVGWKRTEYNGGITPEEQAALLQKTGATDIKAYLYGNFREQLGFSRTPQSGTSAGGGSLSGGGALTGAPLDHARTVVQGTKEMGMPRQAALIALMTGLVESELKNYANSKIPESMSIPHDAVGSNGYSVGIMQQQSGPFGTYWGTVAQCMDPLYATKRFLQELQKKVPNYQNVAPGPACQTVQVSANPGAYATRQGQADALLNSIGF